MARFGVLGTGDVGRTLARGLRDVGHDVRIGSRDPEKLAGYSAETKIPAGTFAQVAEWAESVVLAVKGSAAEEALRLAGPERLAGKVIIDTTNPIADEPPADGVLRYFTGPNESLMERLQAAVPGARFVKAFSCVGAPGMVRPQLAGGPPTMFYCGNDAAAKADVARLLARFGWEVSDMGTVTAARAIEPLAILWCIPGFRENRWSHALKLLTQPL